ncbi:MAG: PAS domain S-box protein [Deltaproteobacteria bacterium]|nr:PAS domain S-box protein [Deltaproteobacteria bacterium]
MPTRILLADEHQVVRQGLRSLLDKELDFDVVEEADSGEEVVRLAREAKPDVVILDLGMAGLKGLHPVHQIMAAAPSTKVIGLSMYGDRRFVVEVLMAGAYGYVLKDYAFEELAVAIRAVQDHKTYISQGLSNLVIQDYIEILRDSEGRFRTIFEGNTVGVALLDRECRIVECNSALQELLGYSQDELTGQEFSRFGLPDEVARCKELFNELLDGKRPSIHLEKHYKRKDGRLSWGRLTVSPFRGVGHEGQFALGMLEDISHQKQAETRIRDYQEKLRSVVLELSITEERERRRLATDLHDHVGQILALAQIKLGAMRGSASACLVAPMDEIRRLIEQTICYTRSMTFELSPPILYDLGFEAAVEWLGELLQEQYGIRLKVAADRTPKPLDDEIRVLLFQMVRELLVNVVKRSKPNNIAVLINRNGNNMWVKIENDGAELDLAADSLSPSADGLGLFSIRERLTYLGGRLEVESAPNQGTLLTMVVPLKF